MIAEMNNENENGIKNKRDKIILKFTNQILFFD